MNDIIPAVVLLLVILIWLFFTFNKNASLKRKVHLTLNIVVYCAFLSLAYLGNVPIKVLVFITIGASLVLIINLRTIRFCDTCGVTLYNMRLFPTGTWCPNINLFSKDNCCPRCGAELK